MNLLNFENIYDAVRLVPYGRVTTYGAVARYLGNPKSARTVGWAMNSCSQCSVPVPAHRVVNRQGALTGKQYFCIHNNMQQLLEAEGIKVIRNRVVNFEHIFWDPNTELI